MQRLGHIVATHYLKTRRYLPLFADALQLTPRLVGLAAQCAHHLRAVETARAARTAVYFVRKRQTGEVDKIQVFDKQCNQLRPQVFRMGRRSRSPAR